MGVHHSTPVPTYDDFDYDPCSTPTTTKDGMDGRTSENNNTVNASSGPCLSKDLPWSDSRGQFYGIHFKNLSSDVKDNSMILSTIPGASPPRIVGQQTTTTRTATTTPDATPTTAANNDDYSDGDVQTHVAAQTPQPPRPPSCSADGWHVNGHMDAFGGRLVVRDRHGKLVAVVECTTSCYLILGLATMYPGQPPKHNTSDGKPLYVWARIYHSRRLGLQFIIEREDTKAKYVADACGEVFGPRMIRIVSPTGKACGFARQYFPDGVVTDSRWDLLVGPGVDPSIMICFVAILNRYMGSGEIMSSVVRRKMRQMRRR